MDTQSSLGLYLRILSYFRPYVRTIFIVLIFNFFFVLANTVSIWIVAPLLTTIFEPNQPVIQQTVVSPISVDESEPSILNLNAWMKSRIDNLFMRESKVETLKILCIFLFVSFLIKNIFAFMESWWVTYIEQGFIKDLRDQTYRHILWQPLTFFSFYQTGNLMSRITNDVNVLNESLKNNFTKIIRDPFMILIFVTLLISISWQLSLIAFIVFPLTGILITKIGQSLKRKSRRVQERIADVTSVLQETLSGVKVVKAFAMEKYESEKFEQRTFEHFKTVVRQMRLNRLSGPLSETLGIGIMVGVLWYGGQLVLSGELLSSEDFIRFIAILFSVMDPIKKLGQFNNDIQISLASGRRVFQILDTPIGITDRPNPLPKPDFQKNIEFSDVYFRYTPEDVYVLNGISLNIEKNHKFAIVGGSGAGKTTMVNLLPRFYDIDKGAIKIDGLDIRDLRMRDLRQLMGIVTQDVILFNDTISGNIAYGLKDYSKDEIIRAAKLANAHNFITQMPKGYDTMIGERGTRLSGGQRQRISIARAILKNPPILIFDEATSSLDSEAERLIQQAIENLMKDRTVLIIAHRLSTIMNSDKIIVLENGKVIDTGTHNELLSRCERYKFLYDLQFTA
ncbi:MAG: ABC transporter ATP-binding protein [Calditrichales bacterium]|nr:MAG: ABC transporter ATP-binding protein [Calditrichales bacterium]